MEDLDEDAEEPEDETVPEVRVAEEDAGEDAPRKRRRVAEDK